MEWIDVKDKYPTEQDADERGNILGWDKRQNECHKCQWTDVVQMKMRFTHWMPLPKSPIKLND